MTLVAPLLAPLVTAIACLLLMAWPRLQRAVSCAGALAAGAAAIRLLVAVWAEGAVAMHVGGWPSPFGIVLVADTFSALLLLLPGLLGPAILLHAMLAREEGEEHPATHPLVHVLLFGVTGAFLAGDVFNLYVWFEVLLIASFVLIGLRADRERMIGAIHYVVPNLLCSAVLLAAIGLLYGSAGTLDLVHLRGILATGDGRVAAPLSVLFLIAFGIKAALFPFSGWLPGSYPAAPPWVAALFSALLTKVGLYSLIRLFTLVFPRGDVWSPDVLLVLACLSMVVGVLGAAAQNDHRRILAFHSVSQIGYVVFGLAIGTPLALAGAVLFTLHHALVKSNLFLSCSIVRRLVGSYRLADGGGLWRRRPVATAIFGASALSLAGLPPFSGFVAKLALVAAALQDGRELAAAVALGVSLVTTFSMAKIWAEMYWKEPPPDAPAPTGEDAVTWRHVLTPSVLALAALGIGVFGGPALRAAERAAEDLLDPAQYVDAVGTGEPR